MTRPALPVRLAALLAAALLPGAAAAVTITVDAGGNDYYDGTVDGGTVFVGNVVVERMDTYAAVSLGRTNGQGVADTVPDDGVDHQVLAEIYPQAVGNGCEFVYSDDGFATEATVPMPYDSPAGNNDKFLGVLPGQVFAQDTTVELYVRCVGPTAGGNDFEAFVPGASVNFFYEVAANAPSCNDGDGDGYGSPGDPTCPAGSAADCDDANAAIHPGAAEDCGDGVDNDCDGDVDAADDECAGDDDDSTPGDDDDTTPGDDDDTTPGDDDDTTPGDDDDSTSDDDDSIPGDDDTTSGDDDTASDDDTGDDDTGSDDDTGDDDTGDDDTGPGDDDSTPLDDVNVGCTCGSPGLPPDASSTMAALRSRGPILALLLGVGLGLRRRR